MDLFSAGVMGSFESNLFRSGLTPEPAKPGPAEYKLKWSEMAVLAAFITGKVRVGMILSMKDTVLFSQAIGGWW